MGCAIQPTCDPLYILIIDDFEKGRYVFLVIVTRFISNCKIEL